MRIRNNAIYADDGVSPLAVAGTDQTARDSAATAATAAATASTAAATAQAKADQLQIVTNVAALQALNPVNNKMVRTLGYATAMDGGGATYIAVNQALTDNGGTILTSSVNAAWRWVIDFEGPPKPEWWGATGDGTTDDTAAFNEVQAAFPNMQLTPGKHYRVNFAVTKPGFWIFGGGCTQSNPSVKISPFNNAQYAITFGDDTARLYGVGMSNVTLWGNDTYNYGLRLRGGAYQVTFNNCYTHRFIGDKAVRLEGDTNQPISIVRFNDCYFQRSSDATGSTIYIKNLNGANNWLTSVVFNGCHLISSGSTGNMIEVEDAEIMFCGGSHMDLGANGVGVLMRKTGTPYPIITGDCTAIIEAASGTEVMEFVGFDPGTSLSTYLNRVRVTGNITTTGGTMNMSRQMVPAYTHFRYPVLSEAKFFDINTRPNAAGEVAALPFIRKGGVAFEINHSDSSNGGEVLIQPKAGSFLRLRGLPAVIPDTGNIGTLEIWNDSSATFRFKIKPRTSSPEGSLTGSPGEMCPVNDGGTGRLFIKKTGTGNTGWSEVALP